jgi:hypothetical protein
MKGRRLHDDSKLSELKAPLSIFHCCCKSFACFSDNLILPSIKSKPVVLSAYKQKIFT